MKQENTKPLLSTLWLFVILNIFARDFHELGRPGMLQQMMSGVVDGVVVTEGLMLIGGIMFEIPIVMVLLSRILKNRINRLVNLIAAPLYLGVIIMTNLKPDLDNIFFMIIEIIALIAVFGVAWKWNPKKALETEA